MTTTSTVIIFVSAVLATMVFGELLMRKLGVGLEIARKTFHVLAGTVCIVMSYVAPSPLPLSIVAGLFMVTLPLTIWLNMFKIQSRKRGYGTVAFATGFLILTLWVGERMEVLIAALAVLTYGDGFAAIVGSRWGKHRFSVGSGHKTLEGTATFVVLSALSVTAVLYWFQAGSLLLVAWIALATALLSAAVEAVSIGDIDNGTIPVFSAAVLLVMLRLDGTGHLGFAAGMGITLAISIFSWWRRWVTPQAAIVVFVILATMFGLGGWMWFLPCAFLLFSLSILSKVTDGAFDNPFVPRGGARTLTQIAAKGVPAMIITMAFALTGWEPLFVVCLAVLAAASSDTWASAIGGYDGAPLIRSLPLFKQVPKGMSGGVTWLGTAAAVVGAALLAGFVFTRDYTWLAFAVIVGSGLFGSIIDSVLGSTVQRLYTCTSCGQQTEAETHCERPASQSRGLRIIDNVAVNLVSGLSGGAIAAVLWVLVAPRGP